jgi:prepilin signal peptidase PulO-like enzyme (type II secretory pathway)
MVGDNDNEEEIKRIRRRLDLHTDTIGNILAAIQRNQQSIDQKLHKMYNTIAFLCAVVFGFVVALVWQLGV